MFSHFSDHKLCKLKEKKTEEYLCHFCLIRSLVLRCQSFTGRTSFKPIELMAVIKDEVLSDSPIQSVLSLIQHLSSFIPGIFDHFMMKHQGYLELKGENQDLTSTVIHHLEKIKFETIPSVLLVECQNGFDVNVENTLHHNETTWHCKCIKTPDSIFFKTKKGFCEEGKVEIVNQKYFTNVKFAVFKTSPPTFPLIEKVSSKFIYTRRKENHKIRECTLEMKRRPDRHQDTEKRREDRHQDTEKRSNQCHEDIGD